MPGFLFISPIGSHPLSPAIQMAGSFRAVARIEKPSNFVMPSLFRADVSTVRQVGSWLTRVDMATGELFSKHFDTTIRVSLSEKVNRNIMRPLYQKYRSCEIDFSQFPDWMKTSANAKYESDMLSKFSGSLEELLNIESVRRIENIDYLVGNAVENALTNAVNYLYNRMISASGGIQDDLALKLGQIVNSLGEKDIKKIENQRLLSRNDINAEEFLPYMYHSLFEGIVKYTMFMKGGNKGSEMFFSPQKPSFPFYASAYREGDSKKVNTPAVELEKIIGPIPLGEGVTLEFSVKKLSEYGFFNYENPFLNDRACAEKCFSGIDTPLNALSLESKKELLQRFKLPLSFVREVEWMDPEWSRAASMI